MARAWTSSPAGPDSPAGPEIGSGARGATGGGSRAQDMVRIDYHVHTSWSYDAQTSLEALIERALEAGLTHLCVTDHDTIDGALALKRIAPPELEVIVGCEFSTADGSQVIGVGLGAMIAEDRPLDLMRKIRDQGGLVLIPHPFRRGSGIFRPEMRRSEPFVQSVLSVADILECFNGRDTYDNNQRSRRFAVERSLPAVAGSDAHTASEVGSVFVEYVRGAQQHGRSARRIYFPDRPQRSEHALKRSAMELFHRHEARLPKVAVRAYGVARDRAERDRAERGGGVPRPQYEAPAVGVNADDA